MSAIRAIRQVAVPLVARRTLCTATAVPRVGGMRVASLASSRVIASRGFMSSAKRFGEGSSEQSFLLFSLGSTKGRRRAVFLNRISFL